MATYGNLKTRIAREINRSDLSDEVSGAVQTAIKHYSTHPFVFNTKRADIFLSPGQSTDGPSDAASILILRSKDTPSVWSVLDQHPFSTLEELYLSPQITGNPEVFAWFQQKIFVHPEPSASTSAKISYIYKVAPVSNDADSNAWTNDAEELIRMCAEIDLYETVLRGPDALKHADRLRLREMEYLNRMDQDFTRLYSTGRMKGKAMFNNSRRWY